MPDSLENPVNIGEYRTTSRASVVAQQLIKSGREIHAGQKVNYILVDEDAESPIRRVKALELFDETTRYDPEAYAQLCIRAFENLIPAQHLQELHLDDVNRLTPYLSQ